MAGRRASAGDHEQLPHGSKLIAQLARMHVAVHGEKLLMSGAYRNEWIKAFAEDFEQEFAPITAQLYGEMLESEHLPPGLRATIEQAIDPTRQVDAVANLVLSLASGITQLGALSAPFAQKYVNEIWADHTVLPLPLPVIVGAYLQNAIEDGDARDMAAAQGYSSAAFTSAVQSELHPPGLEALLTMWRRGISIPDALGDALARVGVDEGYLGALEQIAVGPMSSEQAVLGVVQNHLDEASARTILKANGTDPANYQVLYDNAGRPPGPMEMLGAWNRGVPGVSQATVEQAIRESDIKNKYVPVIVGLREHLLPQKTIVAAVHQGVIADGPALAKLLQLGISAENAGILIAEGHNNKVAAHKGVSVSQIETAYEDGSITRAAAESMLVALNYAAADATFILDLVDTKWQQQLHAATIARVKALYLARHIERGTASNDLDAAGVTPAHRDLYLAQWDLVRATPTRTLTESQAASAYRKLMISQTQFRARLSALGYVDTDVDLIVQLNPVKITQAQALKAYKEDVITEAQFRERLQEMGLGTGEQDIIIATNPKIPTTPAGP